MANNKSINVIKSRSVFENIRRSGQIARASSWLVLNYCNNASGELRVGWTIPTYVGGAVVRNRFKRWIREYLRQNSGALAEDKNLDANIVFRRQGEKFYKDLNHDIFEQTLAKTFKKIRHRIN